MLEGFQDPEYGHYHRVVMTGRTIEQRDDLFRDGGNLTIFEIASQWANPKDVEAAIAANDAAVEAIVLSEKRRAIPTDKAAVA